MTQWYSSAMSEQLPVDAEIVLFDRNWLVLDVYDVAGCRHSRSGVESVMGDRLLHAETSLGSGPGVPGAIDRTGGVLADVAGRVSGAGTGAAGRREHGHSHEQDDERGDVEVHGDDVEVAGRAGDG